MFIPFSTKNIMEVKIESSWKNILKDEFEKPYFEQIKKQAP